MSETRKNTGYRLAHTMIRVRDLEATLNFYCGILGMEVLRRTDYPDGRFTNTFIGYGPEAEFPTLELTHNWDQEAAYDKGDGWGHICIEAPDVYKACEDLAAQGVVGEDLEIAVGAGDARRLADALRAGVEFPGGEAFGLDALDHPTEHIVVHLHHLALGVLLPDELAQHVVVILPVAHVGIAMVRLRPRMS